MSSTLHPDSELMNLIDRIAEQDDSALKELYRRTSAQLFGLAFRIVRHRDTAEDVLQEAFLSVWRGAGSYRGALSPPMAWLGLIVRSRALDALRKRTSDRADLMNELDDDMAQVLEAMDALGPALDHYLLADRRADVMAARTRLREMLGRIG